MVGEVAVEDAGTLRINIGITDNMEIWMIFFELKK
jgi:hypothetical protein